MNKYGFSKKHDRVLDYCRAACGECSFGCAKDGAPNCYDNVENLRCEPAKRLHIATTAD